jgi:CSLREA domain-containing protein
MDLDTQRLLWMRFLILSFVIGLGMVVTPRTAQAQDTYVVTSTGDADFTDDCTADGSGDCTLRAAVQLANDDPDTDVIEFDVPTTGGFAKITPSEEFEITEPVTIDGTTQPEYPSSVDGPVIEIDGSSLPAGLMSAEPALRILAPDVTIRGVAVNDVPLLTGISVSSTAPRVTIEDCFVGVAPDDGVSDRGSYARGIAVFGDDFDINNNVISNNGNNDDLIADGGGLYIDASNGIATNNKIGLDHDGDAAAGNFGYGVRIESGSGNLIGFAFLDAARNYIGANGGAGVRVESAGNSILVNRIGTDVTGSTSTGTGGNALGNGAGGIVVMADDTEISNNTVAGNGGEGIQIGDVGVPADNNTVSDNNVGVDANADFKLPNSGDGVDVREGSATTISGNVIGGNASTGIAVNAVNSNVDGRTVISGNYVGTNSSGGDLGNANNGLLIMADPTSIAREVEIFGENIIGHNGYHGIELLGGEHDIAGNYIGTNPAGDALGNGLNGIKVNGVGEVSIGTYTINAQGGEDDPNVIGFNGSHGVDIDQGSSNLVGGNYIGTNPNGDDLGNQESGIRIYARSGNAADGNRIGYRAFSTVPNFPSPASGGSGNVIANNGANGVVIAGMGNPAGNAVRGNLISGNGDADNTDVGIDLRGDGVTSNDNAAADGDTGPNNVQNFPVIEDISYNESNDEVSIDYRVQTAAGNANYPLKVDFYAADSEVSAEGAIYLDTQEYSESNAGSSATKVVDLGTIPEVTKDDHIVVTATDVDGNTSEFTSTATQLPVELISFKATQGGNGVVRLTWKTASETNNAGFDVEHKTGEQSFSELGFVDGAGRTTEVQQYSFRAESLDPGTHVFRLRQVDLDGTATYSDEVEVTLTMTEAYVLRAPYPNPAHEQATIDIAVREAQPVTVTLYNALGQRVRTVFDGTLPASTPRSLQLDGARLSSGLYVVRMTAPSFHATETVTFVK